MFGLAFEKPSISQKTKAKAQNTDVKDWNIEEILHTIGGTLFRDKNKIITVMTFNLASFPFFFFLKPNGKSQETVKLLQIIEY